jgi:hypothetical protein
MGLVSTILAVACLPATAGSKSSQCRKGPDFVGTYLFDGTIESGVPGLPPFLTAGLEIQGLFTLHKDGTVVVRHNFGPPAQNLEPGLGSWKKTGPRTARVVYLFFNVPRIADPTAPTPELGIFVDRVTIELEMDHEFGIVEGNLVNEFFLPSQDPLDPSTAPLGAVYASVSNGRKVLP